MDIDQVNQMVAALHYEIYNQARKEGKEIVDAFRIADCFIQEMKSQAQDKTDVLVTHVYGHEVSLGYEG